MSGSIRRINAGMIVLNHRGEVRLSQQRTPDLSQLIAEEFGANATYVESLLERFRSNPELVDDSWRSYFSELINDGAIAQQSGNGAAAAAPAPEPKPAVATPAIQSEGE